MAYIPCYRILRRMSHKNRFLQLVKQYKTHIDSFSHPLPTHKLKMLSQSQSTFSAPMSRYAHNAEALWQLPRNNPACSLKLCSSRTMIDEHGDHHTSYHVTTQNSKERHAFDNVTNITSSRRINMRSHVELGEENAQNALRQITNPSISM